MKYSSCGSIVVFSLMVLSVILVLTEQLLRSVYVSSSFIKSMVERERAQALALSGVTIALAQLTFDKKKQQEKGHERAFEKKSAEEQEKSAKAKKEIKHFLKYIFPHLNRWQVFGLEEKIDGIDGEIRICISCEEGKININEIFDFEKQEFKKEYEFLKDLEITGKTGRGEIFNQLSEFFKKRQKKINDISELCTIPCFSNIDIFYKPPLQAQKKGEKNSPNSDLFLQDIFTIWTSSTHIHPLLFSDSLCAIFRLRRPVSGDAEVMKEGYKQLAENYTDEWGNNVDEHWKFLEPIYGQKPKNIKNMQEIFSKQFGPKTFSVLSYGKVESVEQRLLAVIKQIKDEKDADDLKKDDSAKQPEVAVQSPKDEKKEEVKKHFRIMALYWL